MKFFSTFPPRTKILAPPLYTVYTLYTVYSIYCIYILYIYVVTCAPPPFLYVADSMGWGMECAIGMARRAMALPDFKLVGPAIHLALPEFVLKTCQLI